MITSATPTTLPNLVQIRPRGSLGEWVKYNEFYLFIYTLFSWTHLQVRSVDRFSRLMAQTTRTRARMCLSGGFILRVKCPYPPQFLGVNKRFQAIRAKYWKFHVIEPTASILTKWGVTIETTKWSSRVVQIRAQQIQNGGRPPFWKKTVKALYLYNRSTDFDEIWHGDAYWPLAADQPLKFWIFENPRWRRPPSWKITKITVWPSFTKFGMLMHNVSLNRSDC